MEFYEQVAYTDGLLDLADDCCVRPSVKLSVGIESK